MASEADEEMFVDLSFKTMSDFAPDKVAEQMPALAELLKMRRQLEELLGYMDGKVDAEKRIAQLLNERAAAGAGRRGGDGRPQRQGGELSMAEEEKLAGGAAAEAEAIDLGEFSDLLEKDFRVKDTEAKSCRRWSANLALAAKERSGTAAISGNAVKSIKSLIAGIDELLTEQMNEILHCPRSARDRGHLARAALPGQQHRDRPEAQDPRPQHQEERAGRHLEDYEGQMWDQSPIFKKLYTDEYSMFGGEPFGAIIGAYEFSHKPKDVGMLRNLSGICASAHAPFIAAAAPQLFRMESWQELPNPQDLEQIVSSPDYASWQSLRESEDARYIGLTMPRVLAPSALRGRDGSGQGFRLRGRDRRQARPLRLDERRLRDGGEHQPQPQALLAGARRSAAWNRVAP